MTTLSWTLACTSPSVDAPQDVRFDATDGGEVFASVWRPEGPVRATILAFHQGGASGRAEYGPIAPRLAALGYEVMAVDQRAGGELFGGTNRTAGAYPDDQDYCGALPDVEGALAYARAMRAGRPLILWGSSYSGALVLRAAARNDDGLAGVLAFSPASGGPMAACRGEEVSGEIGVPVLVLRPAREMELESASRQADVLRAQGHEVFVADPGEHGSSMLVADRVDGPVEGTWERVERFLEEVIGSG